MCRYFKGESKISLAVYQRASMYIRKRWPGTKDIGLSAERERQKTRLADLYYAKTRPEVGKHLTQSSNVSPVIPSA